MAARRRPASSPMSDIAASSPIVPRRAGSQAWWNAVNAWLLLLPAAVLLVAFTHYPTVASVIDSFFSTPRGSRPPRFVGRSGDATGPPFSKTEALSQPLSFPCG